MLAGTSPFFPVENVRSEHLQRDCRYRLHGNADLVEIVDEFLSPLLPHGRRSTDHLALKLDICSGPMAGQQNQEGRAI